MKINSIFTYISLVFCVAIIGVNSILFATMRYYELTAEYQEHQNDVKALRIIEAARLDGIAADEINRQLLALNIILIEKSEPIISNAEVLKEHPYGKLLRYDNKIFAIFYRLPPPIQPVSPIPFLTSLLEWAKFDEQAKPKMSGNFSAEIVIEKQSQSFHNEGFHLWFVLFLANLLVVSMFVLIIKKLYPILSIRETIKRYGEGELNARSNMQGKDEIAFVAAEFDKTADKINALLDARVLFLRNLLHELKTPITTARLTAAVVEDEKLKNRLDGAFERIDAVVNNSVIMERLASGFVVPNYVECSIAECVDEAISKSSRVSNISVNGGGKWLCDRELIMLAIKNLIENAIKHGKKDAQVEIVIADKVIEFHSYGTPLTQPFENYLIPFNRKFEGSKGLGLGLWIVSQIVKLHRGTFEYKYKNDTQYNIFSLHF